jgi:hypothetical protein
MASPPLPQLRAPCTCTAGRTCTVCRAYARRTPQPTRAQVLGGIQSKLKVLRERLPQEEARLAAIGKPQLLETQVAFGKRRKRAYETVVRIKAAITALEARLAA